MLPNGYVKFKYIHVAFRHWPTKLRHLTWWLPTNLPTYLVKWLTLCTMLKMIIRKNHQSDLKSGISYFQSCLKAFWVWSFFKRLYSLDVQVLENGRICTSFGHAEEPYIKSNTHHFACKLRKF